MSGELNGPRDYHRMSIGEKQAHARERMREPAIMCPVCDMQTTAADLLAHVKARCTGPRDPGPAAKWITWREALELVPRETLARWVRRGEVRFRGERQDRLYLHRDVVVKEANRRRHSQ